MEVKTSEYVTYDEPVTAVMPTKITRHYGHYGLGWGGMIAGLAMLLFLSLPLTLGVSGLMSFNEGVDQDSLIPFMVFTYLIGIGVLIFSTRNVLRKHAATHQKTREGKQLWEWDHDWEAERFHQGFWRRFSIAAAVFTVWGLIMISIAIVFYMNMDIATGDMLALYIVGGIFGGSWLLGLVICVACLPMEWKLKGLSIRYAKVPSFTGEAFQLGIQMPEPYRKNISLVVQLRLIEEQRYKERSIAAEQRDRRTMTRVGEYQIWGQQLKVAQVSELCNEKGQMVVSFQVPEDQPGNDLLGSLTRTWQVCIKPKGHWYALEYHFLVPIYDRTGAADR